MRHVNVNDSEGHVFTYKIRDTDAERDARRIGILVGPPDVRVIDWEQVCLELNNALVEAGILTHDDVIKKQGSVTAIVNAVVRRRILSLYDKQKS